MAWRRLYKWNYSLVSRRSVEYTNNKIGILSRHAVSNYGSILQALALQEALRRIGYSVEYVNYRISRDTPLREAGRRSSGIVRLVRAIPKTVSSRMFEKMRSAVLGQSEVVMDAETLATVSRAYAALCVGSDQVWNFMSDGKVDGAYLLEFANDCIGKYSYAASFGRTALQDCETERFRSALEGFTDLSVREESGIDILSNLGQEARVVVDPVHLLTADDWSSLIPLEKPLRVNGEFALIYNLHPSDEFDSYVRRATSMSGMKVLSIRPTLRPTFGRNLFFPSLGEFLWCFQNASVVYTDSFHGTAFSILFNTPFVEVLPKESSERNLAILREYDLEERLSKHIKPGNPPDMNMDWPEINRKLTSNRDSSLKYLKSATENALIHGRENTCTRH